MIQATECIGTQWLLDLCTVMVLWKKVAFKRIGGQPVYRGKGDSMECGSYRGIKLL